MAKTIDLTRGKVAIVDDRDYDNLSKHSWYCTNRNKANYAVRSEKMENQKLRMIYMHRVIMNPPNGMYVDHIDRDGLNNTRANLRLATMAENGWNKNKTRKNTTSAFKGVSWHDSDKKYRAKIKANKKEYFLGNFENEEDAAWAYDRAARQLHGAFARCNFYPPPMIIQGLKP